ncbi:helix-turn-helix transcriptional regulator [Tsuneonella mangrovi]|uniref:helix-turn-helix transcriptional regulator n=1 Tax=Tsuneonella mangrovi TaxID=1982042 RepID=UPI000BA1E19F|nr:AraC family transcriptional regulator [Tsuneonella mangrovi]
MGTHVEQALKAAQELGGKATLQTWIGVLGPFGEWLGWPDWYFEGTDVDLSCGVPHKTTYRDGLVITANILEHGKSGELIDRTLKSKRLVTGPDAALIVRNAPTLEEASRSLVTLLSATNPCVKIYRSVDQYRVKIQIVEQIDIGGILGFYSAIRVILFSRMIQGFLVDDLSQMQIFLTLSKDESGFIMESELGAQIEFGARNNGIIYPKHWEQRRNFDFEESLWRLALADLGLLEKRLHESDFPNKIRSCVKSIIERENRVPRLKEIALRENISVRTLCRRLSEADIKYQEIVDDLRMSQISRLIVNPGLPLQVIARDTGYADVSSFSRAFKSWFGECPSQYRSRLQRGKSKSEVSSS